MLSRSHARASQSRFQPGSAPVASGESSRASSDRPAAAAAAEPFPANILNRVLACSDF